MNEVLELAVSAHGGLDRWKRIRSIDVSLIISGQLLEVKGFPEHQHTKVTIDADRPRTVMEPYGEEGARGIYTLGRVWIEARNDGREIMELKEPRASFAGHVRDTKWDQLQRLYFLGYAMWNYLATPFIFLRDDFDIQELAPQEEDGQNWRVLQVRALSERHTDVLRYATILLRHQSPTLREANRGAPRRGRRTT